MNVSNYTNNGTLWSTCNQIANTSMSPFLSKIVLGTSVASIVGVMTYRLSHNKQQAKPGISFIYARAKVQSAYAYVFGGFALTTLAGTAAHVSGFSLQLLKHPYLIAIPLFIGTIVSAVTVTKSNKNEGTIQKVKWVLFNICMGASLSTIGFFSKQLITQAAVISLGIGGTATLTSYLAPDEKFLKWEGPFLNALACISLVSFASLFFPGQAAAYGLNKALSYGGLAIFTGLLMSRTQRLYKEAKEKRTKDFDPIKASLSIYMDGLNIFVRVLDILTKNKSEEDKKKKAK